MNLGRNSGFRDDWYRYSFQNQEHEDEIKGKGNSINYTYRMHDPRLGRFFAVDPLAFGYPHNSPYAFSENRLIDATELEGLEMVLIHGTWANRKDVKLNIMHIADYKGGSTWGGVAKSFSEGVAKTAGWSKNQTFEFEWSGKNSGKARRDAAKNLVKQLLDENSNPEAGLKHATLMGHSHGGNVAKIVKKKLEKKGWTVDIITIATPQRSDTQSEKFTRGGVYLNFFSKGDLIQWIGSGDDAKEGSRFDQNRSAQNYEITPSSYTYLIDWFSASGGHSIHREESGQEQMLPIIAKNFSIAYPRTPSVTVDVEEMTSEKID